MTNNKKTYQTFPMKDLVELAKEYLSRGKEVVITAKGRSMKPLLRDSIDRIILSNFTPQNLRAGDVVLYERNDGSFVIHRIVDINDGMCDLLGDFQTFIEKGVPIDRIIAVSTGFIRGEKEFSVNAGTYKLYVKIWGKKSLVRRAYVFCSAKLTSLKRRIKNGR